MTNSADPDQLASSEANRSGSTLLDKAGYIRVQQDKGWQTPHLKGSKKFLPFQNFIKSVQLIRPI